MKKVISVLSVLAVLSFMALGTGGTAFAKTATSASMPHEVQVCSTAIHPGFAHCMSIQMVNSQFHPNSGNSSSINTGYLYGHVTGNFHDVKTGSNGSCGGSYLCTAMKGYDGPTGLGTPKGVGGF